MVILRIEHNVRDYASWKKAFDADPLGRARGGVIRYQIARPADDANYVLIDLHFEDAVSAETFQSGLKKMWDGTLRGLITNPQTRILEVVEEEDVP